MARGYRDEEEPSLGRDVGSAELLLEREKALLVRLLDHNSKELWIPKSQIHDDSEVYNSQHNSGVLVVTEWFADKEGL